MSGNYRIILIIFSMYSRLEHTGIFIRQYKLSKPIPNTTGESAQTGSEPLTTLGDGGP